MARKGQGAVLGRNRSQYEYDTVRRIQARLLSSLGRKRRQTVRRNMRLGERKTGLCKAMSAVAAEPMS